jgi:shikimate kinase
LELNLTKNLVLTGMMGVGKSTIGERLAKKLSYKFVDIDKMIESQEGCSINSIFRKKSEEYFRKLENKITLNEIKKKKCVISLGGGAFLNQKIRRAVKISTVSFWLDVNLSILTSRLSKSKMRPLLIEKNLNETVKKIYLERKKIYNEASFRIKCSFEKKDEIVNKILKLYENSRN